MSFLARRWVLLPAALTAIAAGAGASTPSVAPARLAPGPAQPAIASTVANTLQTGHYARKPIDDATSRAWFDAYLDRLDYGRLYFLQSDIDEFSRWRERLDDDINAPTPRLQAAYDMHARLMQRMDERVRHVNAALSAGRFDFSRADARVVADRHEQPWAKTPADLDGLWDQRIAEQLLRMELSGDDRKIAVDRLRKRYQRVLADQQSLDEQDVLEQYLAGLASAYDPHSVWFKPVSKENFDIEMRDSLTGIGAVLQLDEGYTVIKELIAGGPAERSGAIDAGDRIIAVAQKGGEPVDVVDMRLDRVVQLIRGPIDTTVTLTVQPADATDPSARKLVNIVRDKVKLDQAAAKGEVRQIDGARIGVIDVPSFYVDNDARRNGEPEWASTARDTAKILVGFNDQGVDAVVVDLRQNGGGALDQAIELTGLFLRTGPVVQIRDKRGQVEVLEDEDPSIFWEGPLVVLTSEASASASEIFAAAIQDHGRGIVVGSQTTHGKGTVQNLLSLDRFLRRAGAEEYADLAGAIKFTTHKFYRVNGGSTQIRGVSADVVLPSPYQGLDILEGDLDHALPWDAIVPAIEPAPRLGVDLTALRAASAARVKQDMGFGFLLEDLAEREKLQDRKEISLHEPTRRAEIDRRNQLEEARKAAWQAAGHDPEAPPDTILEEALRVTRDVVRQLHG